MKGTSRAGGVAAVVLGIAVATSGCDRPKPLPTESVSASSGATTPQPAFASMSPEQRVQAADGLALAGDGADPDQVAALLEATQGTAERTALQQRARPRFAAAYAKVLEQKQKPGQVSVSGAGGTTLLVRGEHCSKFLLENFVGAPEAKTARLLGFSRVACESRALKLAAEL